MAKRQAQITFPMAWEEARACLMRHRLKVVQFAAHCGVSTNHVRVAITKEGGGQGTERVRSELTKLIKALQEVAA